MFQRQIWIIDFGSQYTQLITRKLRELQFSSEIITVDEARDKIAEGKQPQALVLSGGPQSVFSDPEDYTFLFNLNLPTLGVCYGMQLIGQYFGGKVEKGQLGEYGPGEVSFAPEEYVARFPVKFQVWMSHSDHVAQIPPEFSLFLTSTNGPVAGIINRRRRMIGLQFHPEVEQTQFGKELLFYFCMEVAALTPCWPAQAMIEEARAEIARVLPSQSALCAFSGGVDSLVAATLAHQMLGERLHCFFVDNGLLRPQDGHHILQLQQETPLNINIIDAKEIFLKALMGVHDPEQKRKIIGKTFIEVFEAKVHEYEHLQGIKFSFLLQGTLYPDVIESSGVSGRKGSKSVTIKSHHNVGGLPERMQLQLLEPLKYLFKDEVRKIGRELDLRPDWIYRHPFPGPGIGVRVLGELSSSAIQKVQQSDQILFEELKNFQLYDKCWQAFTVFLPIWTVGVKGDARAFENVIALRIVDSTDGMTARWMSFSFEFFNHVSARITNEVAGITRVVYDITSKPPGTIEWE